MSYRKSAGLIALALAGAVAVAGCAAEGAASESPSSSETAATYATLKEAIAADDLEAVQQFVESGEDLTQDFGAGNTALHVAAAADAADVIEYVLDVEPGLDIDAKTAVGGLTPLMLASNSGGGNATRVLLDAGADPLVPYAAGFNAGAMHLAAQNNNIDALQVFLDHGIDVNQIEPGYSPPIIFAAYYGATEATFFLLDNGADVNSVDRGGNGLVWNAEGGGYPDLAQQLQDYIDNLG